MKSAHIFLYMVVCWAPRMIYSSNVAIFSFPGGPLAPKPKPSDTLIGGWGRIFEAFKPTRATMSTIAGILGIEDEPEPTTTKRKRKNRKKKKKKKQGTASQQDENKFHAADEEDEDDEDDDENDANEEILGRVSDENKGSLSDEFQFDPNAENDEVEPELSAGISSLHFDDDSSDTIYHDPMEHFPSCFVDEQRPDSEKADSDGFFDCVDTDSDGEFTEVPIKRKPVIAVPPVKGKGRADKKHQHQGRHPNRGKPPMGGNVSSHSRPQPIPAKSVSFSRVVEGRSFRDILGVGKEVTIPLLEEEWSVLSEDDRQPPFKQEQLPENDHQFDEPPVMEMVLPKRLPQSNAARSWLDVARGIPVGEYGLTIEVPDNEDFEDPSSEVSPRGSSELSPRGSSEVSPRGSSQPSPRLEDPRSLGGLLDGSEGTTSNEQFSISDDSLEVNGGSLVSDDRSEDFRDDEDEDMKLQRHLEAIYAANDAMLAAHAASFTPEELAAQQHRRAHVPSPMKGASREYDSPTRQESKQLSSPKWFSDDSAEFEKIFKIPPVQVVESLHPNRALWLQTAEALTQLKLLQGDLDRDNGLKYRLVAATVGAVQATAIGNLMLTAEITPFLIHREYHRQVFQALRSQEETDAMEGSEGLKNFEIKFAEINTDALLREEFHILQVIEPFGIAPKPFYLSGVHPGDGFTWVIEGRISVVEATGVTLAQHVRKMRPSAIVGFIHQVVASLQTLHSVGFVHGSISELSVRMSLRQPEQIVLTEFEFAQFFPAPDRRRYRRSDLPVASPWELQGQLYLPRDDLFRALETLARLLYKHDYASRIATAFQEGKLLRIKRAHPTFSTNGWYSPRMGSQAKDSLKQSLNQAMTYIRRLQPEEEINYPYLLQALEFAQQTLASHNL